MKTRLHKIYEMSIWAHDAIPADEWKFRNMKRVMFPVIDFIFALSGVSAAYYGVPAISEFFPRYIVDSFSTLLLVAGLIAFLGVAFPSLWPFEMAAASIILGLMVGYFISLFILTSVGQGNRGFVLGIAAIAITLVTFRLSLLGTEWQDRRVKAKKAAMGEVTAHAG